jgi:hypothetical protein
MSVVDALIADQLSGEPDRLDALWREHERLKLEMAALVALLLERQLLTREQAIAAAPTLLADPGLPKSE